MKVQNVFLLLLTFSLCAPAFASSCEDVQNDWDNQNYRMTGLEERMGPIQAAMNAEAANLNALLIPIQTAANRVMAVYAADDGISAESLEAVTMALRFVEETLVKKSLREEQSLKLKQAIQQRPAVPLAQQLSEFIDQAKLAPDAADTLRQLTNAVRCLEKSTADWQAAEQEAMQNFLSGNSSLVDGLYKELNKLQERLTASIAARKIGRQKDQERADAANKNVAGVVAQLAEQQSQMDGLMASHQACGTQRSLDEHAIANCERPRPIPREPKFF